MSVYFIQAETGGPIKIGYAQDELKRFQNIQSSHHEKLVLCHAILGDKETEREMHRRFRKYRIRGEWFHPGPDLVKFARASADLTGFWAKSGGTRRAARRWLRLVRGRRPARRDPDPRRARRVRPASGRTEGIVATIPSAYVDPVGSHA